MSSTKSGQAALLTWCKKVTAGYENVQVADFHSSWRDGLAFCAIIHNYHPEAIDFHSLSKNDSLRNNQLAFDVAKSLGVPALLDAEDMLVEPKPEQFSVMTYLSQMYHSFEKGKGAVGLGAQRTGGGGIASITVPENSKGGGKAVEPKLTTTLSKQTSETHLGLTMSRGTTSSPNCAHCGKPLSGTTVEWNKVMYHEKCFVCSTCRLVFANKAVLNVKGLPYCEPCGKKAFLKTKVNGLSASEALREKAAAETSSKELPKPTPTPSKPLSTSASKPSSSTPFTAPSSSTKPSSTPSSSTPSTTATSSENKKEIKLHTNPGDFTIKPRGVLRPVEKEKEPSSSSTSSSSPTPPATSDTTKPSPNAVPKAVAAPTPAAKPTPEPPAKKALPQPAPKPFAPSTSSTPYPSSPPPPSASSPNLPLPSSPPDGVGSPASTGVAMMRCRKCKAEFKSDPSLRQCPQCRAMKIHLETFTSAASTTSNSTSSTSPSASAPPTSASTTAPSSIVTSTVLSKLEPSNPFDDDISTTATPTPSSNPFDDEEMKESLNPFDDENELEKEKKKEEGWVPRKSAPKPVPKPVQKKPSPNPNAPSDNPFEDIADEKEKVVVVEKKVEPRKSAPKPMPKPRPKKEAESNPFADQLDAPIPSLKEKEKEESGNPFESHKDEENANPFGEFEDHKEKESDNPFNAETTPSPPPSTTSSSANPFADEVSEVTPPPKAETKKEDVLNPFADEGEVNEKVQAIKVKKEEEELNPFADEGEGKEKENEKEKEKEANPFGDEPDVSSPSPSTISPSLPPKPTPPTPAKTPSTAPKPLPHSRSNSLSKSAKNEIDLKKSTESTNPYASPSFTSTSTTTTTSTSSTSSTSDAAPSTTSSSNSAAPVFIDMIYCRKCKNINPDTKSKYCASCGAGSMFFEKRVNQRVVANVPSPNPPPPTSTTSTASSLPASSSSPSITSDSATKTKPLLMVEDKKRVGSEKPPRASDLLAKDDEMGRKRTQSEGKLVDSGEIVAALPPTEDDSANYELSEAEMTELTKTSSTFNRYDFDEYLHNSELQGWLKKKDNKGAMSSAIGISGWKKKWFTLQEQRLIYYPSIQERFTLGKDNPPEGIISLQYATSIVAVGKKGLKIVLPERTYEVEADETPQRDKWLQGLQNAKSIFERLEEHTGQFASNFGITKEDMRKEGEMEVKNKLGNWRGRYLVLVDGMLLVFSSKLGMKRKTKFPLYECKMSPLISGNEARFGFRLESSSVNDKSKELVVSCADDIEMQMWLNAILKQKIMIEETINLISF